MLCKQISHSTVYICDGGMILSAILATYTNSYLFKKHAILNNTKLGEAVKAAREHSRYPV